MRRSVWIQSHVQTQKRRRTRNPNVGWIVVVALALAAMACSGSIGDPKSDSSPSVDSDAPESTSNTPNGTPETPVSSESPRSPNGTPSDPASPSSPATPADTACSAQAAAPAPLARLTSLEYHNTVADLFPGLTLPELVLPADNVVEGFDNNANGQTASPALIEAYGAHARAVADLVIANRTKLLPCNPSAAADEAACGAQWISTFGARAYRRPISTDEKSRLVSFFEASRTTYDFPTAVGLVVQAVLQAPQFLYRVEIGGAPKNGTAALSGYELASRLSYFFWDTMPDAELLDAAGSGALDTSAGVAKHARRLLADPRARAAVATFHRQWLRFDKMDAMQKSASLFPSFNAQVAESLRDSAAKFVDHVFWDMGGSLDALLMDNGAYVNDDIASIYGLPKTGASELEWRQTDATRRSGILTQAGLLAGFAHETSDSPVLRGVFVMDRFFCSPPPPPPPSVNLAVPEATNSSTPMTTRDRFAQTHEQGTCASCHHTIDGFGFGFSHYDAVGAWRDTDNGLPVNAQGWVTGTDTAGNFDGAVQLGQKMAESEQVSECVTEQWFRYALGVGSSDMDACTVAQVTKAMTNSQGDMREILIATVSSDAFRNRPEVTQ
jgi:hypothetical protein